MSSYATGKIYKITSPHTDMIYIGSTIQSLHSRICKHKSKYKQQIQRSSKYMFDSGDPQIELIEEYPCNSKKELLLREQYYMDLYSDYCINKVKAFLSVEDREAYCRDYRKSERGKAVKQKYREKNREKIQLKKKEDYKQNREKIQLKKKEDYEKNREKILIQKKQYYYWVNSMGGDPRGNNNNLTKIDPTLFS
jgi:hypothetical protein